MKEFRGECSRKHPLPADQVERLSGADFFPANINAIREIVDTLVEHAEDAPHIDRMVTTWVRRTRQMLHPADVPKLAAETALRKPVSIPTGCDSCHGENWVYKTLESGAEAMTRCSCARGQKLAQLDRERKVEEGREPVASNTFKPNRGPKPEIETSGFIEPLPVTQKQEPEPLPLDNPITQADIDAALAAKKGTIQ